MDRRPDDRIPITCINKTHAQQVIHKGILDHLNIRDQITIIAITANLRIRIRHNHPITRRTLIQIQNRTTNVHSYIKTPRTLLFNVPHISRHSEVSKAILLTCRVYVAILCIVGPCRLIYISHRSTLIATTRKPIQIQIRNRNHRSRRITNHDRLLKCVYTAILCRFSVAITTLNQIIRIARTRTVAPVKQAPLTYNLISTIIRIKARYILINY